MSTCHVYIIECKSVRPYPVKIGVAISPEKRVAELQTGNPYPLRVIASIPFDSKKFAYEFEAFVHRGNKKSSLGGEWFNPKKLDLNRSIRAWNSFCDNKLTANKYDRISDSLYGTKQDSKSHALQQANKRLKEENKQLKQDIEEYLDSKIDLFI